jgi:hypothetical protein
VIEDQRLNRLLPIEMSVLAIGYRRGGEIQDGDITFGLPPRPPLNLDPVELVHEAGEVTHLTDNLSYLRMIVRAVGSQVPVDQLLVAHLSEVTRRRNNDSAWLLAAINELIELLRGDYVTLLPALEALGDAWRLGND